MTSATDELSRMLDERGKEHRVWPSGLVIWHDEGSWVYCGRKVVLQSN